MTRPSFGHWRKRAGTRVKVGGCWPWPRSMMAAPGPKRLGSAASGCRRFGTGLCGSTRAALRAAMQSKEHRYEARPQGSCCRTLSRLVPGFRECAGARPHRDPAHDRERVVSLTKIQAADDGPMIEHED